MEATTAATGRPSMRETLLTRPVISWALYDLANTVFSMNIVSFYLGIWVVISRSFVASWSPTRHIRRTFSPCGSSGIASMWVTESSSVAVPTGHGRWALAAGASGLNPG